MLNSSSERRRRARWLFAVTGVLALVVSACGSDDDDDSAQTESATAETETATADSETESATADSETESATADSETEPADSETEPATADSETTVAAPATTSEVEPGEPYKVAIVGDISGPFSAVTGSAALGMQTAFRTINDAGGVGGHPIEFSVFDAQSTAQGAQSALQQALAEEPDVIAPAMLSGNLSALVPTLEAAGFPVVSNISLPDIVAPDATAPWFYALGSYQPQTSVSYIGFVDELFGGLEGLRVATAPADFPAAHVAADVFAEIAEQRGATVVRNEVIPATGFTSFASQAAGLVEDDIDVLVTMARSPDLAIIVPALRTAGFTGPIIGGEGSGDDALFESLSDKDYYAQRLYSPPQPGDVMSTAAEKYGYSTAGSQFSGGWAQGYVIAAGLEACGFPCELPAFTAGMDGFDSLEIPGGATYTPLSFGPTKHFGSTSNQYVVWDNAQHAVVPHGPPIDVTDLSEVPES